MPDEFTPRNCGQSSAGNNGAMPHRARPSAVSFVIKPRIKNYTGNCDPRHVSCRVTLPGQVEGPAPSGEPLSLACTSLRVLRHVQVILKNRQVVRSEILQSSI